MRRTCAIALLGLAVACGAPAASVAPGPNQIEDSGCGGPSENELDVSMCADFEMNAAEIQQHEARAGSGDVSAMLALAQHHHSGDGIAQARRWFGAAAEHGSCYAVRWLNEEEMTASMTTEERRRWAGENRRRGCSVAQWRADPDGGVLYAQPDDQLYRMRVDCVDGAIEVSDHAGFNAAEGSQISFRTSRGLQTRTVRRVQHFFSAMAYTATPGDEVVAALLRGETIAAGAGGAGTGWTIDGRGAAELLRPLIARCGASAPSPAAPAH